MKPIVHGGRKYRPVLKNGNLDLVATVAYGTQQHRGEFMLSVYMRCCFLNAGMRGGKEIQHFDIPAAREHVSGDSTHEYQLERLTFMMNLLAVRMERDYELRLAITTKNQVSPATQRKYERERQQQARAARPVRMGKLFSEYEEELWRTKT